MCTTYRRWLAWAGMAALGSAPLVGCGTELPPGSSYYDQRIAPPLQFSCAQQTVGCHLDDGSGNAAGNLDLGSYDSLMRRRDTLVPHGPYPFGLLLMKVSPPVDIEVETIDPPDPMQPDRRFVTITTDIRHAAGAGISLGSATSVRLQQWIASGHSRNGVPVSRTLANEGECATGIDDDEPRFLGDPPPDTASFDRFVANVQPILLERCAGSACHGSKLRVLYLTCGATVEEQRWNYFVAVRYLNSPVASSELLRRPLAQSGGGGFHTGGDNFTSTADPAYQELLGWADELLTANPDVIRDEAFYATAPFRFFVNRVEPLLVRKGCMFQNCHSPFVQKFKLLGGSQGAFSRGSQHRNHGRALEMLSLESPDPNQSRIIAKNLFPPEEGVAGAIGITHRGGPLFEGDFGHDPATGRAILASPAACTGYDADNGDLNTVPAYCVFVRWHELERAEAITWFRIDADPLRGIVWVARPPGIGDVTDFKAYLPGADLLRADASLAPDGSLVLTGTRSVLGACGLDPMTADVRGPAVSWNGTHVAFAARSSATEPLRLYEMIESGTRCARIPGTEAAAAMENGILTHDFDPVYGPDNNIVFASTRGNLNRTAYSYQGPTLTPAAMQPNANLYVYRETSDPPVQQLTFMLNQELMPAFQFNGFLIYNVEKRQPGFSHMAMRRQNLDGGGFHPFFSSRGSLGFDSATQVVQIPTLDFAFIAGPNHAPDGAGMVAIANHGLGADQSDRAAGDRPYLHSMRIIAPGAVGAMAGARGVFRSPATLPSGNILVSCADVLSLSEAPFDFDLCEMDRSSGAYRVIAGSPGIADVDAVAIYKHHQFGTIESDGSGQVNPTLVPDTQDAIVVVHDMPMQLAMMGENARVGRTPDPRMGGFNVYEAMPPPASATSFADLTEHVTTDGFGQVYTGRRLLGYVPLFQDASAVMRIPGGTPLLYEPTDAERVPLMMTTGPYAGQTSMPREMDQYYPGERSRRNIVRGLHNAVCGFCHGSISGRELDATINPDSVSRASMSLAAGSEPTDLFIPPAARGPIVGP